MTNCDNLKNKLLFSYICPTVRVRLDHYILLLRILLDAPINYR